MGESGGVGFEACVMAVRQKLRGVTGLDLKRVDREIPLVSVWATAGGVRTRRILPLQIWQRLRVQFKGCAPLTFG